MKMKQYNYIKAPIAVAERIGLADMRHTAGEGFVILSESDMRMVDMTLEEKAAALGCEILSEAEADILVNQPVEIPVENEEEKGGEA